MSAVSFMTGSVANQSICREDVLYVVCEDCFSRKADETDLETGPIEVVGPGSYIHRSADLAGTSVGHTCRRS